LVPWFLTGEEGHTCAVLNQTNTLQKTQKKRTEGEGGRGTGHVLQRKVGAVCHEKRKNQKQERGGRVRKQKRRGVLTCHRATPFLSEGGWRMPVGLG